MQACQPITAEASYTQQTRPFKPVFKAEAKIRLGKMPFISKL